ncbi:MAG: cytochrome c family protein [Deltaproteobacteria bacterium]|nr:cytochrome c family protein [Deltaproteobacteria bacterium]
MRAQQLLPLSTRLAAGLSLLLLALPACKTPAGGADEVPAASHDTPVRLVVLSDLRGYLEPCGCVQDMLGGLARTAGRIEALSREGPTLFLDAGHTLGGGEAESGADAGAAEVQARAKHQTIIDVLRQLDVHTVVAPSDRKLLPSLARRWDEAELSEPGNAVNAQIFPLGSERILVAQAALDDLPESGKSDRVLAGRIRRLIASAIGTGARPDFSVLLMTTGAATARRIAPLVEGGVDLIVVSGYDSVKDGEKARVIDGAVPIVRLLSQGRGLAVIELRLPGGPPSGKTPRVRPRMLTTPASEPPADLTERIARFEEKARAAQEAGDEESSSFYRQKVRMLREEITAALAGEPWPEGAPAFRVSFEAVEASLAEAEWARELIQRYDETVAEVNLAHSRERGRPCPEPPDGGPSYVGGGTCEGCHAEATAFWRTTSHATAWLTLVQDQKTADLDCVGCHLTGWQRDGGVCRLHLIERAYAGLGAGGVQCEACHGPGSTHVREQDAASIRREPPAGLCRQCHRGLHSPDFEPAAYRAKILGPGHGQDAAREAPAAGEQQPPGPGGEAGR